MLSVKCYHAACHNLFIDMLNAVILSAIRLYVIMLSVITLSVIMLKFIREGGGVGARVGAGAGASTLPVLSALPARSAQFIWLGAYIINFI